MGKSSPPPAPDYTAAAKQTSAGNAQQARIAQFGSMTNQVTPYGTVNYTPSTQAYTDVNGGQISADEYNRLKAQNDALTASGDYWTPQTDLSGYQPLTQWTQTVQMTPAEQAMFNQNQAINQQLGNVAQSGVGYVQNAMSNPLQSQALASTPQATADEMASGIQLPNLQSQVANAGDITRSFENNANLLRTGIQDPSLLAQDTTNALYKANTQFLDPQFEQSQSNLENRLANQGITQGSEAYNRAMQQFGNQKQQAYESARNQAIGGGINAAQGLFGMNLQGGQFANQALGQAFGQNVTGQQLANAAANQNNQLALANQQARNAALGQQFAQGLQGGQFANQAAAQNNAQNLANAQFYNQALNQAYQQNLGSAGFQNQAQAQAYSQAANNAQLANQAQQQQFQQNQAMQQAQNAAQAQQFQQNMAQAEFANQAAQGMFGAGMQNAALQNQAAQTAYQQALQSGQFQNQTAAQALAQAQALQQNPINMLNAVRTGQQMQVAQMPQVGVSSPSALNQVAGPDLLGAATAQGQYNQNVYNANQAAGSGLFGSLLGAAGTLGGAGIMKFSDIRLKKNIIKLGIHKTLGIGLYTWDYLWGEKGAGVMAQELEKVMPEAVITMPNGFKAVNYSMLGA